MTDRSKLTCPHRWADGADADGHGWEVPWYRPDRANVPALPGLVADEPVTLPKCVGGTGKTTALEQERRHTRARRASAALGDTR